MSANIYWRPTGGGKRLPTGAPSSFLDAMERAFGRRHNIKLDSESDALKLDGMAAVENDPDTRDSYEELASAIRENGEIEIFAVY